LNYHTIAIISIGSNIFPIAAGILVYKYLNDFKIFFYFLITCFAFSLIEVILSFIIDNNMFMLHIFTVYEYLLIVYILLVWQDRKQVIIPYLILTIPYLLFWTVSKLLIENPSNFDNISSSLSCGIITILSAYTLLKLIKEGDESRNNAIFWFVSGFLLYYSGNLVLFALSKTIINDTWILNAYLSIIVYLIYTGGFLKLRP